MIARVLLSVASIVSLASAQPGSATPNLVHDRHHHAHNHAHPTERPTDARFFTTRASEISLPLPSETEAFTFVVFGDRTGGPDEGVNVLADAVRDVNLFEPDLVMTVGDLIDGYNDDDEWLVEMREYKAIMSELLCPWFPVAGNHDTYQPRGPVSAHDDEYEMHFGPLWYSFRHKNANFIILYTDEGNPETGEKSIRDPDSQRMSAEQLRFLEAALERGADADHQFVFVHHPRWLEGNYGGDWNEKVHPRLVGAGNVTAVFAGHIHRMRSDAADGIEYVTLATVGGSQRGTVPEAGWLHHYHVVTVRPQQVALAAVPVGDVIDVRDVTGEVHEETTELATLVPVVSGDLQVTADRPIDSVVTVEVANPTSRPIEFTLMPESRDQRWSFYPDHTHGRIEPGDTRQLAFDIRRPAGGLDDAFDSLRFALVRDYLTRSQRYHIPEVHAEVPVRIDVASLPAPTRDRALRLNGQDQAVLVPSEVASVPQGPFTIECWFRPDSFSGRVGLLAKTQNSEYSVFVSNGTPSFSVHLGGEYRSARTRDRLETGRWQHIAGVYDGATVTLFVDGQIRSRTPVDPGWARTTNELPLFIGADPGGRGAPMSFAHGQIDEVRLTAGAVYSGTFAPERRLPAVGGAVFHYRFDRLFGTAVINAGPEQHGSRALGAPRLVDAAAPEGTRSR